MAIFRDISLSDKTLRQALVTAWQQSDMATVLQKLADAQAANKGVKAAVMNGITTALTTAQQAAETRYKTGRIKTSSTTPTGMTSGQVFFKEGAEEPSSVTITWDGDITGKTAVQYTSGATLYKVANAIEFSTYGAHTNVVCGGETQQVSLNFQIYREPGNGAIYSSGAIGNMFVVIVDSLPFAAVEYITDPTVTFTETGVYFSKSQSVEDYYVSSITIEDGGRTAFTWNGDTTGKASVEYQQSTFYKVADAIQSEYCHDEAFVMMKITDGERTVYLHTPILKQSGITGGAIYVEQSGSSTYTDVIIADSTTIQIEEGSTITSITVPETGIYVFNEEGSYLSRFEVGTQE